MPTISPNKSPHWATTGGPKRGLIRTRVRQKQEIWTGPCGRLWNRGRDTWDSVRKLRNHGSINSDIHILESSFGKVDEIWEPFGLAGVAIRVGPCRHLRGPWKQSELVLAGCSLGGSQKFSSISGARNGRHFKTPHILLIPFSHLVGSLGTP